MEKRLFTSESVTEGHPDKICDQISDAVLDALYAQDPYSRVACETLTNTGFVMVMGEITTKANVDIPQIVRDTVVEIGYDSSEKGFDGNTCAVMVALDKQSADIAMGVDKALEAKEGVDKEDDDLVSTHRSGAGDEGRITVLLIIMMVGRRIIEAMMAGGMLEIIRENGGIDFIINKITAHVNSKRGAELSPVVRSWYSESL